MVMHVLYLTACVSLVTRRNVVGGASELELEINRGESVYTFPLLKFVTMICRLCFDSFLYLVGGRGEML